MKKSIIIPIVAALMSVVVAVSAAVIIQDATDGNIWHKVTVIDQRNGSFYGGAFGNEKTFNVVNSQEELMALYNEYGGSLCSSCNHLIDEQIRRYNDKFFRNKSLAIIEISLLNVQLLSLDRIYLENNTLNIELYRVEFIGPIGYNLNMTVFVEIKKSEIQSMIDKKLTIVDITEDAFSYKEYNLPKGRENEYRKDFHLDTH